MCAALRLLAAWLLACCAFALPARADPVEIVNLSALRNADGLLVSAQLRFTMPAAVDEAMLKGIPMAFVLEASVLRNRWYWYDKEVITATRHVRLSYHPLTGRWRVIVSATPVGGAGLALGQNYDTRDEALAALQRISGWKIASLADIDDDGRHYVNLRFRLDTSQLPRPLQIGVVGHSDWTLDASRSVRVASAGEAENR